MSIPSPQELVGKMKGVQPQTVLNHMCDCIRAGLPVDVERLGVTDKLEQLIIDTIRRPPINSGWQTSILSADLPRHLV